MPQAPMPGPPPGQTPMYNPFAIQNLWAPMAAGIDQQTEQEIAKLTEDFGASGMRWSSPLMRQMAGTRAGAAQKKNELFSQLQYEDAQRAYERQRDAAQMASQQLEGGRRWWLDKFQAEQAKRAHERGLLGDIFGMGMQERQYGAGLQGQLSQQDLARAAALQGLGGAQSQRDREIMQDLFGMGMQQRGLANEDLAAAYNDWLRQQNFSWDTIGKMMGTSGGYQSDYMKKPSTAQEYAPYAAAIASIIGSIYSSREAKDEVALVEDDEAIEMVRRTPVYRWKYKADPMRREHIGPMAEDFHEATRTPKRGYIEAVDALGVVLAANRALLAKVESLERKVAALEGA